MTVNYAEVVQTGGAWILEDGGEKVALLVLEYEPSQVLIFSIAVDSDHQKLGYGRSLMRFVEDEAVRKGYTHVQLYTNEHMHSNIFWYQHLGYIETHLKEFRGNMIVYMEKMVGAGA